MFWLLLTGGIAFLIFFIGISFDKQNSIGVRVFGGPLIGLIVGAFAAMLIGAPLAGLASMHAGSDGPPLEYKGHDTIVLMADDSAVSGSWSLFGGSVAEGNVFNYYSKDANGQLTLNSKPAEKSIIIEDSADPYVDYYCQKEWDVHFWYIEMGNDNYCTYYFHIPTGSVQPGIALDARG